MPTLGTRPRGASRLPGGVREEVGPGGLQPVGDRDDVAQQQRPRLRERDRPPPTAALEQAHAERRLQRGHVLAHRGLRVVEGVGRTVERALLRDRPEAEQLPEAEVGERLREDGRRGRR